MVNLLKGSNKITIIIIQIFKKSNNKFNNLYNYSHHIKVILIYQIVVIENNKEYINKFYRLLVQTSLLKVLINRINNKIIKII